LIANRMTNIEGSGISMYANRRSSERRACRSFAKIQFSSGLPRDCMISDVSDGGVKIIAEYPEIPSEFTVIFSEGRPRQCRLAWRIGCELGAQFLD
jgi:hypothetical protein